MLTNKRDMVSVPMALSIQQERLQGQMKELWAGRQEAWALGWDVSAARDLHCYSETIASRV